MSERLDWAELVARARAVREREGLTQRTLATLAGVSIPTVVKFEKGSTALRLDRALAILEVLGLTRGTLP